MLEARQKLSGKRGSGSLAALVVNKDESKRGLTVLSLKLNQGIKEAITLRKGVSFCFASCAGLYISN